MKHKSNIFEAVVHGIFLILGLITVGCVLLITIYLIISGIPAIRQIGLFTVPVRQEMGVHGGAAGIRHSALYSHQRLRHRRGRHHRRAHRIPDGGVSGENGAKARQTLHGAGSRHAGGHPLRGLRPCRHDGAGAGHLRKLFHIPDGASLLAAIIVLAVMILPSIIKVSDDRAGSGAAGIRGRFPCAGRDA